MKEQKDLRPTLIYCRESRDENGEHYERIETQRDVLLAFCERLGLANVVEVILDDNCSGTSFRRMEGILRRVKRREVEVLVFKDSSRLGRNLKESLAFVELVEEYGGEILFESEAYNEDIFPLQAWFNERRAREDSQKIRRILRHKMETGTLLVKPHYGYRRGADGHTMVPEEETAAVVRRIFHMAAQGKPPAEIAARLNGEQVPTPSQTRRLVNAAPCWNSQHIRRILQNNVYLGVMTHHKTSRKSYKNKRTICHGEEEWIVLEEHHEPLVSPALFAQAARPAATPRWQQARPFSGLLRCGRCGSLLVRRAKKGRSAVYLCGKNHREGTLSAGGGCLPHSVGEGELEAVCKRYIRWLTAEVDLASLWAKAAGGQEEKRRELEEKLRRVQLRSDSLYEDFSSGLVGRESYCRLQTKYDKEAEKLRVQMEKILPVEERSVGERLTAVDTQDIINQLGENLFTGEILRAFLSGAVVFEPQELTEERGMALGLTALQREELCLRGGVVFLARGDHAPQRITAGWL